MLAKSQGHSSAHDQEDKDGGGLWHGCLGACGERGHRGDRSGNIQIRTIADRAFQQENSPKAKIRETQTGRQAGRAQRPRLNEIVVLQRNKARETLARCAIKGLADVDRVATLGMSDDH